MAKAEWQRHWHHLRGEVGDEKQRLRSRLPSFKSREEMEQTKRTSRRMDG
uniref:Uncharacterized protein n=1 Tax=Physcomitrium patens TaxID=3218 RepID=A0A2K1L0E5_PHYPA|nr:hypothetical protein PHYPA_002289 [Physcomitrium patens]